MSGFDFACDTIYVVHTDRKVEVAPNWAIVYFQIGVLPIRRIPLRRIPILGLGLGLRLVLRFGDSGYGDLEFGDLKFGEMEIGEMERNLQI